MDPLEEIVLSPDQRLSEECAPIGGHRLGRQEARQAHAARHVRRRRLRPRGSAGGGHEAGRGHRLRLRPRQEEPLRPHQPPKVIIADGDERESGEGCLSFPGITVPVTRPSHVVVQALNLDGDLMQYEAADNLLAICLQHEIDHLHGVTMIAPSHAQPARHRHA